MSFEVVCVSVGCEVEVLQDRVDQSVGMFLLFWL